MKKVAYLLLVSTSFFAQEVHQEGLKTDLSITSGIDDGGCCAPQPPVCKPVECCVSQLPEKPQMCGFNAPAEINVGCQGAIDLFARASFLYWQPSQDNMTIGLTDTNPSLGLAAAPPPPEQSIIGDYIEMNFSYRAGFQIGLGMNLQKDGWEGYAEYTRVHGSSSASSNGPDPTGAPRIFSTFGHPYLQSYSGLGGQLYNTVSATYRNNLDFLDVEMGRVYYVGKRLIFRSAWGARAAWILQNIHVQYKNNQAAKTEDPTAQIASLPSVCDVFQNSHSWAVGPRTGLITDWILGRGFRFFGSLYGDLLYTKYKVRDKSIILPLITSGLALTGVPVGINTTSRTMALRTHFDLEMGLGWGSYFDNNNFHVDLSLSYSWQIFFDQNMFREYSSPTIADTSLPYGNLYVQGLIAKARIDF